MVSPPLQSAIRERASSSLKLDTFLSCKKFPFSLETNIISCQRRDSFLLEIYLLLTHTTTQHTHSISSLSKRLPRERFSFKFHHGSTKEPHAFFPTLRNAKSIITSEISFLFQRLYKSPLERGSNSRSRFSSPGGSSRTIKLPSQP